MRKLRKGQRKTELLWTQTCPDRPAVHSSPSSQSGHCLWSDTLGIPSTSLTLPSPHCCCFSALWLLCFPSPTAPLPFLRPLPSLSLTRPAIHPHPTTSLVRLPSPDHPSPAASWIPALFQLCVSGGCTCVHVQVCPKRSQKGAECPVVSFSALFP